MDATANLPNRLGFRVLVVLWVVLFSLILWFVAVGSLRAGVNEWTPIGPPGAEVHALVIDPVTPRTIYAGTSDGVYRSADGGQTWDRRSNGLPDGTVWRLIVDPLDPSRLYTLGEDQRRVFRTMDGGLRWEDASGDLEKHLYSLAIDPVSPNILYAGADDQVLRSSDFGASWTATDVDPYGRVLALAVNPVAPEIVYAGMSYPGGAINRSTDSGATWEQVSRELSRYDVSSLVIDLAEPNTLYAGIWGGTVLKTTDGGLSWTGRSVGGVPSVGYAVTEMTVHPTANGVVHAVTSDGVLFRTTNGGGGWEQVGTFLRFLTVAVDPVNPETIYGGTLCGVEGSRDGGVTWTASAEGFRSSGPVHSLALASDGSLLAGTSCSLWQTRNRGERWARIGEHLSSGDVTSIAVDRETPGTIYVAQDSVFKTEDGGETWADLQVGALTIAVDPHDHVKLWAGGATSQDGGLTWSGRPEIARDPVSSLAFDPVTRDTVYAVVSAPSFWAGLFRTVDGGLGWEGLNNGTINWGGIHGESYPALLHASAVATDPATPNVLYVAGVIAENELPDSMVSGVFRSTDRGESWLVTGSGLVADGVFDGRYVLATDPTRTGVVYAGAGPGSSRSGSGLHVTTDGGSTWRPFEEGFPGSPEVNALLVDPANPETLYAGTDKGVFVFDRMIGPCVGDCNEDGQCMIAELVLGVNIGQESASVAECPAFDADADGRVTIDELVTGVNNGLTGCPDR